MNEILTKHFLSMEWDKNCLNQITSISEDTIVSQLDSVLPQWASEITDFKEIKGNATFAVALYLPGRIMSGTGNTDLAAICNIISKMKSNVNVNTTPKTTSENVTSQQNNQTTVFNELLSGNDTKEPEQKQESEFVDFNSPEAQAMEKEFWEHGTIGINNTENDSVQPTPQQVNPTGQPIPRTAWTQEAGMKLKTWMGQHNVTDINQMNNWLNKYCGLDYDHFNPEYVDKFIAWTNTLREKQTY